MTPIDVIRTYLEMSSPSDMIAGKQDDARIRIERVEDCPASFFRYMYAEVGRRYCWTDRLAWTDDEIRAYLEQPELTYWLMTYAGAPAGFFELERHDDGSVQIVYFGLLQEFISRGLGKLLLTVAVEQAWALGANKICLHTCTLDDPAALPNYVNRGFRLIRQEQFVLP